MGDYEGGKSPYGLYDMAGNVFEWTGSLNQRYPYDPMDGREDLTRSGDRVIRGGGWSQDAHDQTVFYQGWVAPHFSQNENGFRCAKSP